MESGDDGHYLDLVKRLSTDTQGIATCLGLQSEAKIELQVIVKLIEQKLSSKTRFDFNQPPPPMEVAPDE